MVRYYIILKKIYVKIAKKEPFCKILLKTLKKPVLFLAISILIIKTRKINDIVLKKVFWIYYPI